MADITQADVDLVHEVIGHAMCNLENGMCVTFEKTAQAFADIRVLKMGPLDEEVLHAMSLALHSVNIRAQKRHDLSSTLKEIHVRGRTFRLTWDDEVGYFVVSGEHAG